jgi:hypothetical protein
MKSCPICKRIYSDDSLNFCLQDGAALSTIDPLPTDDTYDPERTLVEASRKASGPFPPTELLSSRPSPTDTYPRTAPTIGYQQASHGPAVQGLRQRNTAKIVLLSMLGTVLLLTIGGLGAWLLLKDRHASVTPGNASTASTPVSANANLSVTPAPSRSDNSRVPQSTLKPTSTPPPSNAPSVSDAAAIREQVASTLNAWAADGSSRSAATHASYYTQTVDPYYRRGSVSSSYVRDDVARAYSQFSSINIRISNIQVTPEPGGDRATAVFDKTWNFSGDRNSSGTVQQKVWLQKVGSRWMITGERDLKVYSLGK